VLSLSYGKILSILSGYQLSELHMSELRRKTTISEKSQNRLFVSMSMGRARKRERKMYYETRKRLESSKLSQGFLFYSWLSMGTAIVNKESFLEKKSWIRIVTVIPIASNIQSIVKILS